MPDVLIRVVVPLIFQKSLLPGLAPRFAASITDNLPGCRGFTGPVPPPLWMRTCLVNVFTSVFSMILGICQIGV